MQLNADGDVWVRCCMQWRDPKGELWIPDDNGRISIYCIVHNHTHLGYEDDLPEKE